MNDGELTEMQTAAVMMHEMFLAYLNAGFTEEQALRLLVGMLGSTSRPQFTPPPSPNGRHT